MEAAAKAVKVDFGVVTQTWQHKPAFTIERPSDAVRIVSTDDEVFGYVDEGTKPHVIVAHGKTLAFPSGHQAKTRPKVIGSTKGGRGGATVFTPRVNHPGTTARDFTETIAAKWDEQLAVIVQRAIDAELA